MDEMNSMLSDSPTAGTRAITIPLHYSSSASSNIDGQSSNRRGTHNRRPIKPGRNDSDIGNASGSSLGSDWTSSPTTTSQSTPRSALRTQVSVASPANTDGTALQMHTPQSQRQRKDKQRANSNELPPDSLPPLFTSPQSPLGPSMLSSSAYKSVNLNTHHDPDSNEPARLITYTKHSQGFTWNDELFLPSYLLGRHRNRGYGGSAARRRWAGDDEDDEMADFDEDGERCPVTDIFVTDEEAAAMMP